MGPRKTTPTLGITYEVHEDPQQRGRWITLRGGRPTGGYGDSIHMAVNGAIGEARQEARTCNLKVKVVSVVGTMRVTEWESPER
jgi:hypothetical protein